MREEIASDKHMTCLHVQVEVEMVILTQAALAEYDR